jgi:hypothetical protein
MAHAIIPRTKASINRTLRPGGRGGTWGRGPERGALSEGAVVETVTVILVAEFAAVAVTGQTVQVAPAGAPVQAKVTAPVNPPIPLILKV